MPNLLRHPEFAEADLSTYVERLLRLARLPRYDVRVISLSQPRENELGYDVCVTSLVPMYLQLKCSSFYPAQSTSAIIRERSALGLTTTRGAYFFSLRAPSSASTELQHNVLFQLRQTHVAVYAAPLFFRESTLGEVLAEQPLAPWHYRPLFILEQHVPSIPIRSMRMFHHMISIPPHRRVDDHLHRYSFADDLQAVFHSDPELLENQPATRLSDYLLRILEGEKQFLSPTEWAGTLFGLMVRLFGLKPGSRMLRSLLRYSISECASPEAAAGPGSSEKLLKGLPPMMQGRVFGHLLKTHFGIEQVAVATMNL